jgi:DNA (cytosine-5)-methyltransferase 1
MPGGNVTLRLGELFAGYGGLGMAVEEVFGAETAWFSEFEDAPSKILAHHWPAVPNHGDITKIDWAAVEPVDIISGGSPCQDLSLAGRRKGMTEGTRSNLWESMREGIAIIRPKYVVWENVRGALSAGAISEMEQSEGRVGTDGDPYLRAIGRVLGDLADLGYDAEWRGLTAANVGATHGRFRVFLLASLPDTGSIGLEAGRLPGRPLTEVAQPANHQQVLQNADLATGSERRIAAPGQEESGRTRPHAGGRSGTPTPDPDCGDDDGRFNDPQWTAQWGEATSGRSEGSSTSANASGSRCDWGQDLEGEGRRTGFRRETLDHFSDSNSPRDHINWGEYEPAVRRWERVNGPAPRPTEPTGRNNGHRLSPAFVEWMMGLPAGWVTDVPGVNRNAQLKALGNGVVPQQAIAALRDMLAAFEMEKAA